MSECRSLTNFIGNAVATVVVSRWEGALDHEQLDAAAWPAAAHRRRGARAHTLANERHLEDHHGAFRGCGRHGPLRLLRRSAAGEPPTRSKPKARAIRWPIMAMPPPRRAAMPCRAGRRTGGDEEPAKRDDPLDRLKFIPLDADGDIYLTLSGELRLRMNLTTNPNLRDAQAQRQDINRETLGADLHIGPHLRFYGECRMADRRTEPGRAGRHAAQRSGVPPAFRGSGGRGGRGRSARWPAGIYRQGNILSRSATTTPSAIPSTAFAAGCGPAARG
jgi:hypothetical protein